MTQRKRYRRAVLHPVQDGPTPRYVYVSADTLAEIDQIRATYATQRRQIQLGVLDPETLEKSIDAQDQRRAPLPLSKLAARYIDQPKALSRKTRENALGFLKTRGRPLARLDWRDLTAPRVKAWIDTLIAAGLSLGYVTLQWRILRAIVGYCLEMGVIPRCPWGIWTPKIRGARRKKFGESARTLDELAILLHAARAIDQERMVPRLGRPAFLMEPRIGAAALLGLHEGELAGLRWTDIDAAGGFVTVARQYDGQPLKTSARAARLRALPELFEMLYRHALHLATRELFDPQGPVFPSFARSIPGKPRHHRPGGHVLNEAELRKAVVRAGLPNPTDWSMTSLRRTFATLEEAGGNGDLVALAERTRHAIVSSLVKYLRARTRGPAEPGFSLRQASLPFPQLGEGGGSK